MKRVSFEEGGKVGKGGVVWQLHNEHDPMRFASLVARCILALHKITGTEDVDSVNAIVDRAIDKRIMD